MGSHAPSTAPTGVYAMDTFDPAGTAYMRDLFPDLVERDTTPDFESSWKENAVGLLVLMTKVTGEDIRSAKKLRFIVRHGVGYEGVDVQAAKECGVVVCNCPNINTMSVAEVALALTCACAKHLVEISRQIRAGVALNKKFKCLHGAGLLTGKTFGILGGGAIGFATAKKFYGAFDGNLVMYDPYVPTDDPRWGSLPHTRASTVDELLPQVDVLSLHLPLLPSTKDLITARHLRTMKPTAIIVNTARGGIINEPDLFAALRDGTIASAGLDAWVSEPPTREVYGEVLDLENLVSSPHIGAAPAEVQTMLCMAMCDTMRELVDGKEPRNRVA